MHKVLDKADDREDINSISSKGSTNLSFSKSSPAPPTIRVIGFRNFVPAFDVKITEEEAKSVRESRDFKDIKLDDSPLVIKLDKKFEDAVHTPVIEVFEAGPFLVFTYSESVRNGHFKTIQSLESIKVSFSHKENSAGTDLLLGEEDLFLLEVEENECVYIVPKEHFAQKMKLYAVPEEFSNNFAVEILRDKISSIDFSIHRRIQVKDDELIRLGIISKGIFGECYRSFHKENKHYYGISELTIKSPEVLSIVLQQIDVLAKISHSNYPELNSIVSLQVLQQQEEFEPVKLRIISDLGLGSLEEFSAYKAHIKEDWKEEELLKLIAELLRQYKVFNELKVSIRDIRPSNIVFCKESKSIRFLDLSLACICEQDSDINELAGIPKNLPFEVTNNLDQIITTHHNTFLADLYSIGTIIADLVGVQNENISYRRLLVEGKIRGIMREKYPILWERFLCKLLEPEPRNRKEALQNVKLAKEELVFIANSDKDFETFITEKEFATKEELITDYKNFLSYFWDLESFSLIDKMDAEILEKFKRTGDSLRKVTRFSQKLADLYESKGMLDKAASVYERLASIVENEGNAKEDAEAENKENNHPDQDQQNHFLLDLYSKIGSIHKSQKKYNKALEYYEKALYFEYLKDPEDVVYDFKNHMEIAEVYEELGHCDLALETYTKIQERFKQSYKNRANQLQEGLLYERIAGLYFRRNEFLAAVEEAERAIQSYTTCYGKHHMSVGNCEKLLGDIFKKIGDLTEAMKHYEIYFANSFNGSNKQDAGFLNLMEEMSDYYKNRGQFNEAIENYQRAINLSIYQDDENSLCVLYEKLAECYNLQKKYILAVKTLRLCYKLKASNLGENSLELVPIIEKIATNYIQDGEQNEALKEFSRALSILMLYKSNDDPMVTEILTKIGKISPLAFLAYKNYKRSSTVGSISSRGNINKTNMPILISFNKVEDVRGVLGGIDFNVSLYELRELISKECTYLGFFKYNFLREGEVVDILGEKLVKLEECIIKKDGFNHLVIEEGKNVVRQRMTY